jgi:hypothetical protein
VFQIPAAGLLIDPDRLASATGRVAANIIEQHSPLHQQSVPTVKDRFSSVRAEAGRKSAFGELLTKDLAESRRVVPQGDLEATSKKTYPIQGSQSKPLDPLSRHQGTGREMRQNLVVQSADARGSVTSSSVDDKNAVIQRQSTVASLSIPTTGAPQAKH